MCLLFLRYSFFIFHRSFFLLYPPSFPSYSPRIFRSLVCFTPLETLYLIPTHMSSSLHAHILCVRVMCSCHACYCCVVLCGCVSVGVVCMFWCGLCMSLLFICLDKRCIYSPSKLVTMIQVSYKNKKLSSLSFLRLLSSPLLSL